MSLPLRSAPRRDPPGQGYSDRVVVEFNDVSKAFPAADGRLEYAIRGVTFSEADGELYCLLGTSGSGKTTILNLAAGFLEPTEGAVLVDGRAVQKPGPDRAMVFQDYALLPWLTVWDNVDLGLKIQRLDRAARRRRIEHYLTLVGLWDAAAKYPHQLSGGMQQRVSIARALALEPVILLMDEPFGGLDAHTRLGMQEELTRIWQETRRTVLFVTHSVDEAIYLATRILIIGGRPGRILEPIDLDLPRPRDRTSPEFNELKRHVLNVLLEQGGSSR
jgi:NitT/TauT family transport system ATP-binding protein